MKKTPLLICLLIALVLTACAAPAQSNPPAAQSQPGNPAQVRTISVTGSGQVYLAPDVAYVYIGVHSQSKSVTEALNENNAKAQAVASSLQELGVESKDIQTSSFNIYPQQNMGPNGELLETTYSVDNTVYITVRDLTILGRLLEVVVNNGANSINGITFDVLDKSQAVSQARKLAVESARSQAAEMAQVAGVDLGELQTMNVYASSNPTPVFEGKGAAMDASQVPVAAGQMTIRVDVNAVYAIR